MGGLAGRGSEYSWDCCPQRPEGHSVSLTTGRWVEAVIPQGQRLTESEQIR